MKIKNNWPIYKHEIYKNGWKYFAVARFIKIRDMITYYYLTRIAPKKYFVFQKKIYQYLYHRYNFTWKNERAIEIPIIWELINKYSQYKILEIGNVLNHYYPVRHDVLDKYEIAERVINKDVVSFKSKSKYNLIVSISTLEHVGWDEKPREHFKIITAINNLKKLLTKKGQLIITLPIGYNNDLDKLMQLHKIPFKELYCLKRINNKNEWQETDWNDVKNTRYNYPYPNANAILIGHIIK